MSAAPLPKDEVQRLAALHEYAVLDTQAESSFDDLTELASQICQTPIALVTLVDSDRQWFKSRVGLQAQQTPRDVAFCAHAILAPGQVFQVPDAQGDARFADNPLVTGEPNIRFYAGMPLVTADHHALGTLCVIDHTPRQLTPVQHSTLKVLARHVVKLLELRRALAQRDRQEFLKRQLALAVEQSQASIMITDKNYTIEYVNPGFTRLTGYTADEVLGRNPRLLKSGRIPPQMYDDVDRTIQSGNIWHGEFRNKKKNGEDTWERSSISPVTGADGKVTHFVVVNEDVTDQHEARARLQQALALQRAILDHAGYAIISTTPDGTITSFNPSAERMLGWSADDMVGKQTPSVFHDPQEVAQRAQQFSAELGEIIEPGFEVFVARARRKQPNEYEWTYVRRDGGRLRVLLSVTALRDEADDVTGFLGMAIDITERNRAREQLRIKNEELKTFAYTVSHDLKAPLRGITGYAQELVRKHQAGMSERGVFCLNQIVSASTNLDQLIEDLLRYARLDAETPTPTPVKLETLVQGILRERKLVMNELGLELTVEVPPLVLRIWERGLHQVLSNLIDNAIKYSRKATPPQLSISATESGGQCQIRVADNGVGFDMKYHERIFGLFNRLVRSDEFEGTGAGLAIVKKLVDKLEGSIRAESALGQGATFYVNLPMQAKDAAA